jgi:cell pole-organizing protein PopZ
MSKLDPTSESLESILASIRRGLAEQSTDVLTEDGAQQPVSLDILGSVVPGEEPPPRFLGGAGTDSSRHPQVPLPTDIPLPTGFPTPADQAFAGLDDPPPPASMSAALARGDEASRPPPPAVAPAPAQSEGGSKDPLWFLARGKDNKDGVPPPSPGGAPLPAQPISAQPAAPAALAPMPAPKPAPKETALKEIVRGPLPPFFGSSPETSKVEVSPAPPMASVPLPGTAAVPPAAPLPAPPVARAAEAEPQRGAAPVRPSTPAREVLANGKAGSSLPVQPAAASATPAAAPPIGTPPAAGTPHIQGLDAMVAELLRPMLRQWIDENMPRLVSAALKAEAEAQSRRDPRKP